MSLDKRRQVIANHRKKERDTVTKEWRDRLGFDPTDHEIEHFRALRSDGKSYAVALAKAYGLSVSEATEVARRTSAPVTPATWTPPQPSLQAEDGRPAYTADEVNAIVEHRLGELRAQIEPITRQFSDLTAKEQQAEIGRRADATVKDMQTWPHFETLKPAIVERVKRSWNGETFALSFDAAYRQAFADYLPTLEQQSREKVLAELKQRPAVPEQVTSSTPARSGGAKAGKGGLSIDDAWDKAVAKHGGSVRF